MSSKSTPYKKDSMSKDMGKRKPLSKKVRFEIFKRDSFKCQYCGGASPEVVLHVDHINPVSKGGDNDIKQALDGGDDYEEIRQLALSVKSWAKFKQELGA